MDERYNTAIFIIEEGTPDRCVGCHTPELKGFQLEKQVHDGEMTDDEAAQKLRTELEESCIHGRAVHRVIGSKCMNKDVCSIGFIPFPAEKRRWDWETSNT